MRKHFFVRTFATLVSVSVISTAPVAQESEVFEAVMMNTSGAGPRMGNVRLGGGKISKAPTGWHYPSDGYTHQTGILFLKIT